MASASALMVGMNGPKSLLPSGGQIFLDDLAAAILVRLLETADRLVTERVVGADRDDFLVALIASPCSERVVRLR